MKRQQPSGYDAAAGTAFGRSAGAEVAKQPRVLRIRRPWLAFVVGFPGAIGAVALLAALSRDGMTDGAFPLAVASLGLAGVLLVLGAKSRVLLFPDRLGVRFFGLRTTTVRFADLATATFGMVFPSISFALTLTDRGGQRATIHANWWDYEPAMMDAVCRALIHHDVAVDRMTASVIARVLRVKAPVARVTHRPWLRRDRTY